MDKCPYCGEDLKGNRYRACPICNGDFTHYGKKAPWIKSFIISFGIVLVALSIGTLIFNWGKFGFIFAGFLFAMGSLFIVIGIKEDK
jgi:hypothetical protein